MTGGEAATGTTRGTGEGRADVEGRKVIKGSKASGVEGVVSKSSCRSTSFHEMEPGKWREGEEQWRRTESPNCLPGFKCY